MGLISNRTNSTKEQLIILSVLPVFMLILAFIVDTPTNILHGLYDIAISTDILLTDYIVVGGIGAAIVNSSILTLINIYIIHKLKLRINGVLIAAVYTVMGFSYFGKSLLNVWPLYLGGYLYVKYQKLDIRNVILVIMFSTSLAPLVSQVAFGMNLPIMVGLPLGILFGAFCGFVVTPLAAHLLKVHDGYNLYNIGFTAGILGTVIAALLRGFGVVIGPKKVLSFEYHNFLMISLIACSLFLIVIGYLLNDKSFKNYGKILKMSGRVVSDFTSIDGYGITYINMGIMGILSIIFVILLGGTINGPVVGGILTIVGFAAFGKHPKNTIPIFIGVFIGGIVNIWDLNSTAVIISGLFGTTLAPIAGAHGPIVGILAGFIHSFVVMNVGVLHGGMNLYNNGFAGGIVAGVLVPLVDAFKKGE